MKLQVATGVIMSPSAGRSSSVNPPANFWMRTRPSWKDWKPDWNRPVRETPVDIAIAFFDVLEKHGIHKDSRTGYSIGLSYPPDWGERTMSLRRGDLTELEPGMTFHFMTGIWQENWGLETTESILITTSGAECLTSFPRKLFVKD